MIFFLDFVRNVETRQVAIYCVYQPDTQEINVIDLKNSALQKCSATVTKTIKRHPFCLELFLAPTWRQMLGGQLQIWSWGKLKEKSQHNKFLKNFVIKSCHNDFLQWWNKLWCADTMRDWEELSIFTNPSTSDQNIIWTKSSHVWHVWSLKQQR